MNDLKIIIPESFKSCLDSIKISHPISLELEAMILMTVGTCILSAHSAWVDKDYKELETDMKNIVLFFKGKNEKAKENAGI